MKSFCLSTIAVLLFCCLSFANNPADSLAKNAPTVAMAGIYTVNPAAAFSPTNFIRIGQADTAMMTNGISGPVTILIYNGTYNEPNMTLGVVNGSSATNTITFTSFSNDSLQVNISIFGINGTSFVNITKLNFDVVFVAGNVSDISFTNNQTRLFNWNAGNNLILNNNYIKAQNLFNSQTQPQGAVTIQSYTTAQITGIQIKGNIFKQLLNNVTAGSGVTGAAWGILLRRIARPVIENNIFRNINMTNVGYSLIGCCTYQSYPYGATIQYRSCTDTAFIQGNKFEGIHTTQFTEDSISNLKLVIRNNFFTVTNQLQFSGLPTQLYYNNFNTVGSGDGPILGSNISACVNNVFASTNGKRVMAFDVNSAYANYNDFYTSGTVLVRKLQNPTNIDYATFAAYQAGSGSNANGKNVNPKYPDSLDLHTAHPALLATGTPWPVMSPVLKDIDNDNRNQLNPCIGADEFQVPSNDAVAQEFIGSKINFAGDAPQQLSLKFLNNGSASLNQVNIRWSIDGVEQTPYAWTGSVPYDSTTTVNFGSYQFAMMKYTSLKIWTDMPNGAADMRPLTDTVRVDSIMPYARGSFTIGGVLPSVPGFVKAAEYLNYGGVDNPVTINVRNGKYTEQPVVKFARGAGLTNLITFKGENNLATLDTLTFSATGTGPVQYGTMKLDSAAFYTFRNITFQSLNPSYSREVELHNKTRFITFDSCVFTSVATSSSYPHIEQGTIAADSNFIFTNNIFRNGAYGGIKMQLRNGIIKGNRFEGLNDQSFQGAVLELSGTGNNSYLIVDSNYVKNPLLCTFSFGGVCYSYGTNSIGGINVTYTGTNNDISITRNQIYAIGRRALAVSSTGSAAKPVKVYNNFFSSGNGIMIITGGYLDIAFNNFGDSANTATHVIEIHGPNNSFRNNIVYKSSPGQPFTTQNVLRLGNTTNAASFVSNNNAFYFNDTARLFYNGSTNLSLSQWQANTGNDLQSVRTTAAYKFFSRDLHIDRNKAGAIDIYKKGMPLANVPKDIDDSTRNAVNPSIGADEFSIYNNDAGALAITNLGFPVALGANNIVGSLRNYGNNNLTSATVNWSVNGAIQTPYSWTGSISTGDSAVNLPIGNYIFTIPQKYAIKVWTSSPNGIADENILNDSTQKVIYPALCGTYTIAGAAPDFTTLSTASAYVSLAGVTCPVVFNIRDGNYNESDTVNFIPGASAINTVIFQSQSLDSSKVSFFQTESYTGNSGGVLRIDGAQHVKFKAIAFKRVFDFNYHYYFDVVNVAGNATGLSFSNCDFTTTGPGKLISGTAMLASADYTFTNNNFTGGANGIYFAGPYATIPTIKNIVIKDNKFNRPQGSGNNTFTVDLQYAGPLNIENNYLDSCISGNFVGGINLQSATGKITVLKNIILKRKGISGINMESVTGGNVYDSAVVIANNFITIDSTGNYSMAGIYANSTGRNVKIIYNNILNSSTNTNSRALEISNYYPYAGTLKDTIANNNLVSTATGYALFLQQNTIGDINCFNNNLFVQGTAVIARYQGSDYTTIATLPTANGTNTGNVSKNPFFINSSNLHVGELSLRTDGKPVPYVLNDIDNDVRGTVTSTIGADEIVINSFDIGTIDMPTPAKPFAAGNQNITVTLKNYGSATITSANVNWSVNGTVQTPFAFTGSIPFNTTANAVIANYNFVTDSAYNMKFWTSAPNGNTDAVIANDSIAVTTLYPALSGVYTIGGVTPNFKGFSRSTANLKFGGVLGNVTFNVREGIYTDVLNVDSIPFQNNLSVTWQGENPDSTKAIIAWRGIAADNIKSVLSFNNARNITVKNMTVQGRIVTGGSPLKQLVQFYTKNKNITLTGNRFTDSTWSNVAQGFSNTDGVGFISNMHPQTSVISKDSSISIRGNNFVQVNLNTWTAIQLNGFGSGIFLNNTVVENNVFNTLLFSKLALSITTADSTRIIGNKISGSISIDGKDLLVLNKNDIYHEGYSQNAVTVTSTVGRVINKPVIVSNNMIRTVRVGTYNGAPVGNNGLNIFGDRVAIIHNTIATSDTGNISGWSTSAALNMVNSKFDTVKNNILYNINGGNLLYHQSVTNLISNNNDYVYSRNFSNNAANLAAYRTLYAQDAQSVENINPYFRGPKDLHASNILLKTAPAVTPANVLFTADIDGQARTAPACMGADEFLQPANDMIVLDATPKKIFPEGINDFKINVYNNGTNAITAFNATALLTNFADGYTPTNAANLNYTFSGNIAPGATQQITLGQMSVPLQRNILKVNTNNLNGGTDEVRFNDSLQYDNYYAGLNGTYTFKDYIYQDVRTATFKSFSGSMEKE